MIRVCFLWYVLKLMIQFWAYLYLVLNLKFKITWKFIFTCNSHICMTKVQTWKIKRVLNEFVWFVLLLIMFYFFYDMWNIYSNLNLFIVYLNVQMLNLKNKLLLFSEECVRNFNSFFLSILVMYDCGADIHEKLFWQTWMKVYSNQIVTCTLVKMSKFLFWKVFF